MASKISTSQVHAPNFIGSPISDDDLLGGFLLALWTGGRQEKTLLIFEERRPSDFQLHHGPWPPGARNDGSQSCSSLVGFSA